MTDNNFIWADLSTFDLKVAQDFYSKVFDWEYNQVDEEYFNSETNSKETSGLYEMPEKFRQMNMPSFWMSYIQVDSVEATVQKAKELGGKVEFVDTENSIGKLALVRDPSGAGFTVYEGTKLNARTKNTVGTVVWNELFVSKASLVLEFYKEIFNWKIEKSDNDRYLIFNSKGEHISAIQEISNEIKGKHEYWAVFFAVNDLDKTKESVLQNSGKILYEDGYSILLSDPFGAIFHIVKTNNDGLQITVSKIKWKAVLGLVIVISSIVFNLYWFWGLLFFVWIIPDIRNGATHLFEAVTRKQHPILYWLIMSTWIMLSLYSVVYYAVPNWFDKSYADYTYYNQGGQFFALNDGNYIEKLVPLINKSQRHDKSDNRSGLKDTLKYKTLNSGEQFFVGISTELSGKQQEDENYVNELWEYFSQNDISPYVYDIVDANVYCVYTEFSSSIQSYSKVLLGYKVGSIRDVYEGLESIGLSNTKYAVFESTNYSDDFIPDTWNKILDSNLKLKGNSAIEVYSFDENFNVNKVELRVEIE